MVSAAEALSLILVGAFWGCTNPLMRKGFADTKSNANATTEGDGDGTNGTGDGKHGSGGGGIKSFAYEKLALLANVRVWLPYLINQLGSLLYYKTLASSNLTLSVPICNATAMVFSSVTSALLGERVNQPGRAALGVALVLSGVAVCMYSSEGGDDGAGENMQQGELSWF